MKEDVDNVVLFTALENRFVALGFMEFLVLRANACARGVEDDIDLVEQAVHGPCDRLARAFEAFFHAGDGLHSHTVCQALSDRAVTNHTPASAILRISPEFSPAADIIDKI